jgi:hypothetical protein
MARESSSSSRQISKTFGEDIDIFAESVASLTFGATWLLSLLEPSAVADILRDAADWSFMLQSVKGTCTKQFSCTLKY